MDNLIVKIIYSTLTSSLLVFNSYGQVSVSASISDGKEGIPYANIYILHTTNRTVSSYQGHFSLSVTKAQLQDTLVISCVGYETFKTIVSGFIEKHSDGQVVLKENIISLKEVVFTDGKPKEKWVGNKSSTALVAIGYAEFRLGDQIGTVIQLPEHFSYLKKFRAKLIFCDSDSMLLRLNFFSMKNGLPYQKFPISNILFSTKSIVNDRIEINLEPYELILTGEVFVSLECIENKGSDGRILFAGSLRKGPHITLMPRDKEWKTDEMGLGYTLQVQY